MTTATPELDCTSSVHDLIQRHPATREVFQRLGVDICCGGGMSVEQAARRNSLEPTRLCTELRAAASGRV